MLAPDPDPAFSRFSTSCFTHRKCFASHVHKPNGCFAFTSSLSYFFHGVVEEEEEEGTVSSRTSPFVARRSNSPVGYGSAWGHVGNMARARLRWRNKCGTAPTLNAEDPAWFFLLLCGAAHSNIHTVSSCSTVLVCQCHIYRGRRGMALAPYASVRVTEADTLFFEVGCGLVFIFALASSFLLLLQQPTHTVNAPHACRCWWTSGAFVSGRTASCTCCRSRSTTRSKTGSVTSSMRRSCSRRP